MYRVKNNNEIKDYNTLLEAKMNALLSYKKTNKLVEVLDEEDNIVFSKGEQSLEEVPPTQEQRENAFDSLVRNELSKLFNTIDDYNADLVTLKTEEANEEVINVIETILDDLNIHVGLLQGCLEE